MFEFINKFTLHGSERFFDSNRIVGDQKTFGIYTDSSVFNGNCANTKNMLRQKLSKLVYEHFLHF